MSRRGGTDTSLYAGKLIGAFGDVNVDVMLGVLPVEDDVLKRDAEVLPMMHTTTLDVVTKKDTWHSLWPDARGLLGARQRRHHGDTTPKGETISHPVLAMPSAPRARTIDNVGVDGEGGKPSSKGP